MAKIIKKGRDLEQKLTECQEASQKQIQQSLLAFGAMVISGVIGLILHLPEMIILMIIFVCVSLNRLTATTAETKEIEILKAGIEGENATSECIEGLPDTYTAFRNLVVEYDNKTSEIDILLVGPTGLFIIETKNLNGHIQANLSESYWTQHKMGRGGTPYSKEFYSPVKQVNTHVYRLANTLKQQGVRAYVNPVVYFANEETTLEMSGSTDKAAVFWAQDNGVRRLMDYIRNNPQTIPQKECDRIVGILEKL